MEEKIKEIIRQVGDIGEKVSRLLAEKAIPEIELDIIMGDLRVLYENIRVLRTSSGSPEKGPETKTGTPEARSSGPASGSPNTGTPEARSSAPASGSPKTGTTEDPSPAPASGSGKAKSPAGEAGGPGSGPRSSEGSILADKYKSGKTFINESLAGQRGNQDIGSKIQSKPIRNISSALGINDRFKLINELFNGDKESFQNTIGILDGAANFNEAFTYINSSFDWDMEEDSVQLLLDLVRRKFIINQNE